MVQILYFLHLLQLVGDLAQGEVRQLKITQQVLAVLAEVALEVKLRL
jgi:hypothetical protein